VDRVRACAMYLRSAGASRDASPYSTAAPTLWRAISNGLSKEDVTACQTFAIIGFHHNFRPVTFTLEAGHWISLDMHDATISYNGKEKRTPLALASRGVVFLPFQHTELAVGPTRSTSRHFIEALVWVPVSKTQTWTLLWHLFEVVRENLISVMNDAVATAEGDAPPADTAFDVRRAVRLDVNDSGDLELSILNGPRPRVAIVETETERREADERRLAHDGPRVPGNATTPLDVHRPPSFAYANAEGCDDTYVYGWSGDRTEMIAVHADKRALRLSETPSTFDLSLPRPELGVSIEVFDRPVGESPYCTDVIARSDSSQSPSSEKWKAVSGRLTIEVSRTRNLLKSGPIYRATVRLDGAEFVSSSGVRVRQTHPIVIPATVPAVLSGR